VQGERITQKIESKTI